MPTLVSCRNGVDRAACTAAAGRGSCPGAPRPASGHRAGTRCWSAGRTRWPARRSGIACPSSAWCRLRPTTAARVFPARVERAHRVGVGRACGQADVLEGRICRASPPACRCGRSGSRRHPRCRWTRVQVTSISPRVTAGRNQVRRGRRSLRVRAAGADGRVHVGLDLRLRQRRVVDADLVDGAGEVLRHRCCPRRSAAGWWTVAMLPVAALLATCVPFTNSRTAEPS